MEKCFVGLDISKDETAICVRSHSSEIVAALKKVTDPDVLSKSLRPWADRINCIVLETGRMTNWLYNELADRGLPIVCIDARRAHAILSQMHNKTDENDAAMLSEPARTGFYKKIEVKSRLAQVRRALLRAREVAIKSRMNAENTIRGLLASFGVKLPKRCCHVNALVLIGIVVAVACTHQRLPTNATASRPRSLRMRFGFTFALT